MRKIFFTALFWLVLVACSSSPAQETDAVPTAALRTPAAASTSAAPSPAPTATPIPPTAAPASPTPSATAVPRQCLLLGGYEAADFPQIISSPFVLPRPGKDDGHHGVDFAHYVFKDKTTIAGAPIHAFLDGTVAASIQDSWPYGNFLIIETRHDRIPPVFLQRFPVPQPYSLYHLYAHMEAGPPFTAGDPVFCGETLGAVGNSGWSGNYHLHFEIRFGPPGQRFDSMAYYQTTSTEQERLNYEFWRMDPAFILVDPMELLLLFP